MRVVVNTEIMYGKSSLVRDVDFKGVNINVEILKILPIRVNGVFFTDKI